MSTEATTPALDANGDPVNVPPTITADDTFRTFMAGRVPVACGHYIAASEARAGFNHCERCGIEPHVYTREELQSPVARPRVRRGKTYRVAAPRTAKTDDLASFYAVPSPCCGVVTRVPQYAVSRPEGPGSFECGKPYFHQRGNPRRGGCRSRYKLTPVGEAQRPAEFDLVWTGQ